MLAKIKDFADNISPIRFFVVTALFFGFLFIIITPPFQTPDEPVHFFRAYQISNLNFVVDNGPNLTGGYLPEAIGDTVTLTATNPTIKFLANKKHDVYKTFKAFSIKIDKKHQKFFDFSSTTLYPPISYLPQVTGIWVARLFNAPPIAMMYLARLFNLISWVLICSLAIYLIPRKKWAIVFLGLLPMSLFDAGSMSVDVMSTGSVLLFLVFILKLKEANNKLTKKQILALFALAITMTLSKQIMFVFLPLIFLLPNRAMASRAKANLLKALVIIVPLIFYAIWFAITKGVNLTPSYTNNQIPIDQLKYIIYHPHSYINDLWNTYFFTWGDTITRSFIGAFGWLDTPLSEGLVVIGYIGLSLTLILSVGKEKIHSWLNRREKMIVILVGLLYWAGMNTALYMYYSPVGFKIIVGLQGRYFLPLAFLLIPLLYSKWISTSKSAYQRIVVYTPLLLLFSSIITLYVRFYVNNV